MPTLERGDHRFAAGLDHHCDAVQRRDDLRRRHGDRVVITTSPATISLSGGTIPAGGSCTITVNVIARNQRRRRTPPSPAPTVAAALTPPRGTDGPRSSPPSPLQTGGALSKAFSPWGPIAVSGTSTLTMVSNFNQTTLSPITFTDTLPAGTRAE